jgi:hypothetical protein
MAGTWIIRGRVRKARGKPDGSGSRYQSQQLSLQDQEPLTSLALCLLGSARPPS